MKKELFRHLLIVMLIALSGIAMTSCGDDDPTPDEVKKALEGDWQFDHGSATAMGHTVNISRNELLGYAQQMGVTIWDETLSFKGNKVNGVKYVMEGDVFYFDGYEELSSILEISDQTLRFTYDMTAVAGMDCRVVLYYSRK